jgi:hypothetical protein
MYMPPYTEKGIMEGFSFAAWLKAVGLTKMEAAKALGISPVYASMLSARPYDRHYRRPSRALVLRCGEVARQKLDAIAPYAEIGKDGV